MKSNFTDEFERLRDALATADRHDAVEIISGELSALHVAVRALQQQMTLIRSFNELFPMIRDIDERMRKQLQLPTTVSIEASELLFPADGFYALEYDDQGRPYRWTGPQQTFCFNVWVDRNRALSLDLHTIGFGASENANGLRAIIDGSCFEARPTESGFRVSEIPPRPEPGPTTIVIEVAKMLKPAGEDLRTLGVLFHRLYLSPQN